MRGTAILMVAAMALSVALAGAVAGAQGYVEPALDPSEIYQNDGGEGGDASDVCPEPSPVVRNATEPAGQLFPVDDEQDNWAVGVNSSEQGGQVNVTFLAEGSRLHVSTIVNTTVPLFGATRYRVSVFAPGGCADGPLNETTVDQGNETEVSFTPEQTGNYTLQLELVRPSLTDLLAWSHADLADKNRHCAPYCFDSYQLGIS